MPLGVLVGHGFGWRATFFGVAGLAAFSLLGILTQACVVGIIAIGERRRVRDAAILLIPNCVMLACNVLQAIASLPELYAQPWAGWIRQLLSRTITWPFNLGAFQLVGDLEMLAPARRQVSWGGFSPFESRCAGDSVRG